MLKQDVVYLKGEFGRFKGKEFERTVRERYFSFFGNLLRISSCSRSFFSIFEEDLDRAKERADLLALILGKEVIPTVIGVEIKEEIVKQAEEKGIFLIKTDY